jgi:hypothetical protein
MRLATRRLAAASLVVITAGALAGCGDGEHPGVKPQAQIVVDVGATAAPNGVDQLPPPQALEQAIGVLESKGSYRVTGTTTRGSAIDISFKVGVGSVGTVRSGSPVRLVAADGVVYVTGDAETLSEQVGGDVDGTIAGKWMLIPPDSTSRFAIFADGATFATAVLGAEAPSAVTDVARVDGVPAVGLVFPESGATLWVAAHGEPIPLRFEEKGASANAGVLRFTDFGADVAVKPPAKGDILDVAKIPTG